MTRALDRPVKPARARGRWRRLAALLLGLGLLLGAGGSGGSPSGDRERLSPELKRGIMQALADGRQEVGVSLAVSPADVPQAADRIASLGGRVTVESGRLGFIAARLAPQKVPALAAVPGLQALDLVGMATVNPPRRAGASEVPGNTPLRPQRGDLASQEAILAPQLRAGAAAEGRGVTIAIIDTGVDPGHPDLGLTTDGRPKLVDWVDFTSEGDVPTAFAAPADQGVLNTSIGAYRLPEGLSKSGTYHFGVLREDQVNPAGRLGRDLNRNGVPAERLGVLVVDAHTPGEYDTVLVDANGDRDFSDEQLLGAFRDTHAAGWLGSGNLDQSKRLFLVVTRVAADGSSVNLGFDGHGHGTQVAAIEAANPLSPGGVQGVAPGARLMVLKALDSSGDGSWDNISRAMIYAAEAGAQIISLSAAGTVDHSGNLSAETQLMTRLSRIYNALIVVASGNGGPGLSTTTAPGESSDSLTVGAVTTPQMWQDYYGYPVTLEGLAEYSAVGPRRDGSPGPNVVAPGMAYTAVPRWLDASGKAMAEGTSVAVPYVAGGAALLMDLGHRAGMTPDYRSVKRAIELGARPLPNYQVVEQGRGVVQLPAAWRMLKHMGPTPVVGAYLDGTANPLPGLEATDTRPGRVPFRVASHFGDTLRLALSSTAYWLSPDRDSLTVAPNGQRQLPVRYQVPPRPGLFSALVQGADPRFTGPLFEALSTVVNPYEFTSDQQYQLTLDGSVDAAQYRRFFFRVPAGVDGLTVVLHVPRDPDGNPTGRVRPSVFAPDGNRAATLDDVGLGVGKGTDTLRYRLASPLPGVWEVVLYAPPEVTLAGRQTSFFRLQVSLSGVILPAGPWHLVAGAGADDLNLSLTARNLDQDFTGRLVGAGFGSGAEGAAAEVMSVAESEPQVRYLEVGSNAVWLRVTVSNPTPRVGNLDLTLYWQNPSTREWQETGEASYPRTTYQVVELPSPAPGRYAVMVSGYNLGGRRVDYQYQQEVAIDTGDLRVTDADRLRRAGETWTVPVRVKLPPAAGRYYGRLAIFDAGAGSILTTVPVVLDRSLPSLDVRALPRFTGADRPALVTLEVRDARTGALLDAPVVVDGTLYQTSGGHLTLPAPGGPDGAARPASVHAVVDTPGYAWFDREIPIPAPRPLESDPLLEMLHRKLTHELP